MKAHKLENGRVREVLEKLLSFVYLPAKLTNRNRAHIICIQSVPLSRCLKRVKGCCCETTS